MTNSGRASTLAATDAATPPLRRIERAAIAAATPITYHSRYLLLPSILHIQASIVCHYYWTLQFSLDFIFLIVCSSDLTIQGTSTLDS